MGKLKIIADNAAAYVSNDSSWPEFQTPFYLADGSVVVSDRHQILLIENVFSAGAVEPKKNTPDFRSFIPTKYETEIELASAQDVDKIAGLLRHLKAARSALRVYKDRPRATITTNSADFATLNVTGTHFESDYHLGEASNKNAENVTFNLDFLINALNVMKSAKQENAVLKLSGRVGPMVLTAGDITCLWLPLVKN
jgi:DNA polymerase III sliding clamp (beta) subunit (PCNA family)